MPIGLFTYVTLTTHCGEAVLTAATDCNLRIPLCRYTSRAGLPTENGLRSLPPKATSGRFSLSPHREVHHRNCSPKGAVMKRIPPGLLTGPKLPLEAWQTPWERPNLSRST